MRDFLLDTQTIRYWYDKSCPQHTAVMGNIEKLRTLSASLNPKPKLLVSVLTLGEIEFGHRVQVGNFAAHNKERSDFINEELSEHLDVLQDAVEVYGELRMRLFNRYAPGNMRKPKMRPEQLVNPATGLSLQIQENDLWICAQAIGHAMVLVTNDRMKVIRDVAAGMYPELIIQNWTKPKTASVLM